MSPRGEELARVLERPAHHPKALDPVTLAFTLLLSVGGSIIGLQLVTTLGLTPNTALIGVLLAIAASRIPIPVLRVFRSIHVQNLAQSSISAATYCAANSLLVPAGIPLLLGRPDLLPAVLGGATAGMLIDLMMLYWFFDSRLFPGSAAWPQGIAAAESIIAGDQGGWGAKLLVAGGAAGILGSLAGIPAAALGITFMGNIPALFMFGAGLLARAYTPVLLHADLNRQFMPHGMMIGAGLVALTQTMLLVFRRRKKTEPGPLAAVPFTRSEATVRKALAGGFLLRIAAAILLAFAGGLGRDMSPARLIAWVLFAAVSCVAAEFIVGFSAMHAGWFPAFATALIFLLVGLVLGFPPAAAALLVGFVVSGGPAFADGGFDLKAGWYLRGWGRNPQFDLEGRRQQIISALIGALTGLVLVAWFHGHYFNRGLFPPIDRVYVAAIRSGIDPSLARRLLLWAIPGAILQFAGGVERQLGILFATGLLLVNAAAGWVVLVGLGVRIVVRRIYGKAAEVPLSVFGAGCIAGNALADFGSSAVAGWRGR